MCSGFWVECADLLCVHRINKQEPAMRSILLWAIGIPIPIIILIAVFT